MRRLLLLWLLIAAITAPWYVYKYADVRSGRDFNNTSVLIGEAHHGRDLTARLTHAGTAVLEATTFPGGAVIVLTLVASLGDRRARWLLGLFVVPLGFVWAVAFSYDTRNLAMTVPFVGMAAGVGIVRIVCWWESEKGGKGERGKGRIQLAAFPLLGKRELHTSGPRVWHAVGVIALATAAAATCVRNETLLEIQVRQQREVGIAAVNDQLYKHVNSHPGDFVIAGDYEALRWLPDLGRLGVTCPCSDLADFRQTFERADVRYILLRGDDAAAEVCDFLARPTVARLLFEEHGYTFYEKITPSG